ncbi:hypothetical protein CDAR_524821 [Caerostris darwini]|uniref:Uncharacterized protein n=1 Tax=Caerostris darwini TaxID=1538125 RepID=A0AAV4QX77_9ARAC|nr:hypothetical protein CDAR_524821 [Caerostris darwini]
MDGLQFLTCVQPLLPPVNPLEAIMTPYFLDLVSYASKTLACTAALLSAGIQTIYNRFPPDAWLHIFTDGSKLQINGTAGAEIFYNISHTTFF